MSGFSFRGRRGLASRGLVVLIFVLVLAAFAVPVFASGAQGPERPSSALSSEPAGPGLSQGQTDGPRKEIVADRTADTKTFALPGGLTESLVYAEPVNYQDAEGEWEPIREGFVESEGTGLEDRSHPFEIHLPDRLGDGPVRFGGADHWISFELDGAESAAAELEGDGAVTYEGSGAGPNFEYSTLPRGLEETMELTGPSSPATVHYLLRTSPGLTPELDGDGSIAFRAGGGRVVATIPAPTVAEGGSPVEEGEIASYALSPREAGGWGLALKVDPAWLEEPGRAWPVTVDPTLEPREASGNYDCKITSQHISTSYCAEATLKAAAEYTKTGGLGNKPGTYVSRDPLNFEWSELGLPSKVEIKEAQVKLYAPTAAENVSAVELRRLTSAWNNTTVTWSCAYKEGETCHEWTNRGGDFNSEGSELHTGETESGTGAGWWDFSKGLAPVFQNWTEGGLKAGFILKLKEETASETMNRSVTWDSSRATETAKRPRLRLVYMEAAPATNKLAAPTEGARTPRFLPLRSQWVVEGNVNHVTYEYKVGKEGRFAPIPLNLIHTATGGEVKEWPIPISKPEFDSGKSPTLYLDAAHLEPKPGEKQLQKEGGTIYVRAVFEGSPGAQGYSEPVEVIIDRATGGAHDATAEVGPGSVDLQTGNFTMSRTDVSIPTFDSGLEFGRSYSSRHPAHMTEAEANAEVHGVLGPGWKPSFPVEEAGGSEWTSLVIERHEVVEKEVVAEYCEEGEEEGGPNCEKEEVDVPVKYAFANVTAPEEVSIPFEETSNEVWATPPELTGWALSEEGGTTFKLKDPAGDVTTFSNQETGGGNEYVPVSVSEAGSATQATLVWGFKGNEKQLKELIAPAAPGLSCSEVTATGPTGCKALKFNYSTPSGVSSERLMSIEYLAPGNGGASTVADYGYGSGEGRLTHEYDPRIEPNLVEEYGYAPAGELETITSPGQDPWTLGYGTVEEEVGVGRLLTVKRASLLSSPTTATTTIAYGVPLTGSNAPYQMSASEFGTWGQKDPPEEATAIFPPSEVPSSPPSSWAQATVYYVDSEGYAVDTLTPKGAGTSEPSISVAEPDEYGNIVRELTPDDRLAVTRKPEGERAKAAELLSTERLYGAEGTQLEQEWGPEHQVEASEGGKTETFEGRLHRVIEYKDRQKEESEGLTPVSPDPHLPTVETVGTFNLETETETEERITDTKYNWALRKPTETIVDPGGLSLHTVTVYEEKTGLAVETREPENAGGGGAASTKTTYYKKGNGIESLEKCESRIFAGLPCKVGPSAQLTLSEMPELLVTKYLAYNSLGEPTEVTESPGGGTTNARKTRTVYDGAGRVKTRTVEGGGVEVPITETLYNTNTGAPEKQQFVRSTGPTEIETTTYNAIGQATEYEDADGNKATMTYDIDGRPSTVSDAKGTQTFHYNETSGLLTSLEDSGAGTFTATYDADGNLIERGLPNGLTAKETYNSADEPVALTYGKEGSTWYEENLERAGSGQILTDSNTLADDEYLYDKDGRIEESRETPLEEGKSLGCTTRKYGYDKDSNRTARYTRSPGVGGECVKTGGTLQSYTVDAADRLYEPGKVKYDAWGRITSLPGTYAGGSTLTTEYFSNNMVEMQSQGAVTNTYEVDPSGRQRQRIQAGGVAGTEIFHYDGPGDSPSWTSLGSTWSRNITGIGGELAAVQESSGTVTFKLTDLHGDVVASASSSPTASKPSATYRFDEFGEPEGTGAAGRFGWVGGKGRRTELSSGVIQMGARSYIPQLGRFLTPDPVRGGSANAYDYARQDPVNVFDLAGECTSETHETCKKHNKTGPTGESRHEARRLSRREHHTVVRDLKSGTRIAFVISHQVTRSDVNRAVRNALAEVDNAPHMGVPFAESVASRLGANVEPTTSGGGGPSACSVVGYAGDFVGVTTGAAAIGASLFPPAGGTLVLISGVSSLIGAAGDTLGKEGVC